MSGLELCPGCAYRYSDPDVGLCSTCHQESAFDAREQDELDRRRAEWRRRKRRSRRRQRLRPRVIPHAYTDPSQLADEALVHLADIREAMTKAAVWSEHISHAWEEACECVRQLAWGPES